MAKTDYVPREIIQDQLLVALDDKSKVAIVLDETDLSLLISAAQLQLRQEATNAEELALKRRLRTMLTDMNQLRKQAFP